MAKKRKRKKVTPRNWVAVAAHFRVGGAMKSRRAKRVANKLRKALQEALSD